MSEKKKKQCIFSKLSWITWIIIIAIVICVVISAFSLNGYFNQRRQNAILQNQIDDLKSQVISEDSTINEDSLYIEYYRELSNKTDNAISSMLTIVGIIAGLIMIFTTLAAFKAPKDIEKRIDELKAETQNAKDTINKANEAIDEAKYQSEILNSLTRGDELNIITSLSEVIDGYPRKHEAYKVRGNKKLEMENYDGAMEDFLQAARNGMSDIDYNFCIARVYLAQDDYNESIKYFTKVIKAYPDETNSHYNRGLAYFYGNNTEKSIDDLKKSIEISPELENPYAYYFMFKCYKKLADKETDVNKKADYESLANTNLEEAFRLYPNDKDIKRSKSEWDKKNTTE